MMSLKPRVAEWQTALENEGIRMAQIALTDEDERKRKDRMLEDGERVTFSMMFMDSRRVGTPIADGASAFLRDSAGSPITLVDAATGAEMKLNEDLITAIETEAAKASMSVPDYVKHVLKFSYSRAKLSGLDPERPGEKSTDQG
jgi:hypothetical protein